MRTKETPPVTPGEPGTVEAVLHAYLAVAEASHVAPATLRKYDNVLRQANQVKPGSDGLRFGAWEARGVTVNRASAVLRAIVAAHSAKVGAYSAVILGAAWRHALRDEVVAFNPFEHAKRPKVGQVRSKAWTPAEVKAIVEEAERMDRPVVAAAIRVAYLIAQRPCDVVALTGSNWCPRRQVLEFVTRKTGQEVVLDAPEAAQYFAHLGADEPWLVDHEFGPIINPDQFRKVFALVRDAAARRGKVRRDLWFSDLRRTTLTEMADAGATTDQLLTVSRHRNRQQLQTYIQRTPRQSSGAMEALRRARQART